MGDQDKVIYAFFSTVSFHADIFAYFEESLVFYRKTPITLKVYGRRNSAYVFFQHKGKTFLKTSARKSFLNKGV